MLIDVNVSLGHWPFQLLTPATADQLAVLLQRLNISQGWVSAVETALHPDPHEYNAPLLDALAGRDRLRAVPVINPSLPGWEEHLAAYLDTADMPAVKILANYHLYALDATHMDALAEALVTADKPLLVQMRLEDERNQYAALQVAGVPVAQIRALAQRWPQLRIACLCAFLHEAAELVVDRPGIWVDLACVETLDTLDTLLQQVPSERILFGSHAPFLYPEAACAKIIAAEAPAPILEQVRWRNAAALLQGG